MPSPHGPHLTSLCCLTSGWTLTHTSFCSELPPCTFNSSSGPSPWGPPPSLPGPHSLLSPLAPALLIWTIWSYNSINLFNFVAFSQRQEGPHSVPNLQQAFSNYVPGSEREPGSWSKMLHRSALPPSAQSSRPGTAAPGTLQTGSHQRLWLKKDRSTAGSG